MRYVRGRARFAAATREFDRQFQHDVVACLRDHGFTPGDNRTFRRVVRHERTASTQIVDFQMGRAGWSLGRFTVNLAVFNLDHLPPSWPLPDGEPCSPHCLSFLVQRLGFFRPPYRGVVDRLLGRRPQRRDHWWRLSDDPVAMHGEFAEVTSILSTQGLRWLDARTSLVSFQWALRQLERRKEWKAALRSPDAPPVFIEEPFPDAS